MRYQAIPSADLHVSTITLGTWVFGGEGWGGTKEKDSLDAVAAAMDHGINCIDTAPIYGDGLSEEIIGRAIKGRRSQVVIATKCGLVRRGKRIAVDLSAQSIQREIDDSLRRLQVDTIDIYQCHWPDPQTPIEKTMEALLKLKEQRKIRAIGVSNFDTDLLKRASAVAPLATCQTQVSLLERTVEKEAGPLCREKAIGILAYGPLAGGILTGKYKEPPHFTKGDARSFFYRYYSSSAWDKVHHLLNELKTIPRPLNQMAINWVRQQPGIASVIVGCRNAEQVRQNVGAADWELTDEQLRTIGGLTLP